MNARSLFPCLLFLVLLSGCHGTSSSSATPAVTAQQRSQAESEREELDLIPPPSKTRYLSVHSLDAWENPYLTIQANMVTVHVMLADANPSTYGVGSMMRPIGARRQDLNVSLDKLGDALLAIPRSSWPYGRVAAVEEAHKIPVRARAQVGRTTEAAMKTLNDLGIVVYEWGDNGPK
ncbi:MAG TPA: hypothetical protein VFC39_13480 [Acidobacteriaceae bacterium]|nr:hypothetical protein [Acidobacteriaceae bacterium]